MSASGIYDDLEKEDLPDPEAFPVEADTPVEGPRELAAVPPVAPEADEEAWPPPVPLEAPGNVGAPAPLPGTPAAAALAETPPQKPLDPAADLIRQQGDVARQKAEEDAKVAEKQARIAQEQDEDMRLAHADYLDQRAAAQKHYDDAVAKFEAGGKLTDPRDKDAGSIRAKLYRAFSFLGGRGEQAIAEQQKKWDDDTERQKANISQLRDNVVRAKTGMDNVDAGRAAMRREADAFNEARYSLAERQGRAQLAHLGVPKADIEQNRLLLQLQAGREAAKSKALKEADEHAIAQARIRYFDARAARKKAAGGLGGRSGASAELADMADQGASMGDLIRANKGRAKFAEVKQLFDEAQKKRGGETKAGAAEDKGELERTTKVIDKARDEAVGTNKSPGPVKQLSRVQAMRSHLNEAIKRGDQAAMVTGMTAIIEEAGSMMSGGKTTKTQADLLHDIQTKPEALRSKLNDMVGRKQVDPEYAKRFVELLTGLENEKHAEADDIRERAMGQLLGEGGDAGNEAAKKRAVAGLRGIFGQTRNANGAARYQEEAPAKAGGGTDRLSLARAALNDPEATPQEKAQAARIIKAAAGGR